MRIVGVVCFMLCMSVAIAGASGEEIAGIGAALATKGDFFVVSKIFPDSPAAINNSPEVGDRIISVGDGNKSPVDVKGLTFVEVVQLIRGPKGTKVRLTIVPAGKDESQARAVSLTRGEYKELSRWGDGRRLAKGTEAPNIEMTRLADKKSRRLADYRGKVVVIEFWSIWCGPCQKCIASLQTRFDELPDWKDQVVLITASVDDEMQPAAEHLKQKKWDKTENVWIDEDAIKQFHVNSLPSIYLIDKRGKVADYDGEGDFAEVVNRLIQDKQ